MSVAGFYCWMTKPGAQLVQGREVVLNLPEQQRALAPRQVFQQFGRPGVGLPRAASHDAGHDGVVQEEVIGAGRQLDQVIGHSGFRSDARC
jgi:hypothetical protein